MSRTAHPTARALAIAQSQQARQQRVMRQLSWLVGLTLVAGGLLIGGRAFATTTASAASKPTAHAASAASATACSHCGVVTAVTAKEVKGQGSGLGIVGGAVVGGLVGNQFGKGSGNTVTTIGGAVAGGYAGNEVEKHLKKKTVYKTTVKMEDGTIKKFTVDHEFKVGAKVTVEGDDLKAR
ncbi:glycine zipper 2TM domain-containing protein [Aquabacterium sp.]|uniref:glycine zipper 2TM domain-containing protein n=1 Tax=Aquabacterium sp. TaxID=1872578 RepID=UPI0035B01CB8